MTQVIRPQTLWFRCIEYLHPFEAPATARTIECPVCGCRYARIDDTQNEVIKTKVTVDIKEPYAVPTTSWVQRLSEEKDEE